MCGVSAAKFMTFECAKPRGTGFKTRFTMMPSGMCKPMTAVAAMMLDRQKALPLDAPQSCKAMSAFEVKPARAHSRISKAKENSLIEHQWTSMDINKHQVPCFLLFASLESHVNPKHNVYSHVYIHRVISATNIRILLPPLQTPMFLLQMLQHALSSSSRAIPAHPWPNFSAATF